MSSALCFFIHASDTGHAEGVPIATPRGRSIEFPSKRNHTFIERKLDRKYINITYQCIIFIQLYATESDIQWGKKVFSQPPIVQVLPLKKMREACNFHHRYTSTMRDKIRKKIQKITLYDF